MSHTITHASIAAALEKSVNLNHGCVRIKVAESAAS
jgi:hypothetical protein